MYQGNLSFRQLGLYLDVILGNGLATEQYVEEERLYFATEKGLSFLSAVEEIQHLLGVKRGKTDETGMPRSFTPPIASRFEKPSKVESVEEYTY